MAKLVTKQDGEYFVNISQIKNAFWRRIAVIGMFPIIIAIGIFVHLATFVIMSCRQIKASFVSAAKVW